MRDKEATQQKILQSFECLVLRDGLHRTGINAVAHEAGVDKVLIYRYFGRWEGLLRALFQRQPLWPTFEEVVGTNALGAADLAAEELAFRFLAGLARELRKRPLTLAVLRLELIEKTPLTEELAQTRKKWAEDMLDYLQSAGVSAEAVAPLAAILSGGLLYLLLHPALAESFNLNLNTDEDWKKVEEGIRRMTKMIVYPTLSS